MIGAWRSRRSEALASQTLELFVDLVFVFTITQLMGPRQDLRRDGALWCDGELVQQGGRRRT
jgi:hypothetical protein